MKPTLKEYFSRVRMFRPNARLYLISALSNGIAMGVYRVLFNFYVLSLGYNEALLGRLITTSQLTALILALPMGYLVDRWGRKNALVTRTLLLGFSIAAMALWPSMGVFYGMNGLFGIVRSISSVAMAPFLMENSGEDERTYLFSFSSGLRMGSIFVGNWVGGYLPTWLGNLQGLAPTSSEAYGSALLAMAFVTLLGLIPLLLLKPVIKKEGDLGPGFAPITYATQHPKLLGKLLFPSLLISIGAGLFMPFMNIFFRTVHNQTDQVIGTLFAWGSLAMGIGLLIAPPIADRLGKIQLVIITQGLSIPFMAMLGFSPLFSLSTAAYYVRLTLMNMSNPIYQTFVMEKVDQAVRSTVASLVSLTWSFGRAFSPTISGWLQVQYGFGPPFAIAITLYSIAILLYWLFFIRLKESRTLFPTDESSPASE
ncbi:MAG: MFS transporter [Anaerolineales bacterium]